MSTHDGQIKRPESGWPHPTISFPTDEDLEEWMSDCGCEATDGCWVEPDGMCSHGYPSWLLHLGLI